MDFKKNTKHKRKNREKNIKSDTLKSVHVLFGGRETVFSGFESEIFPIKPIEGTSMSGHIASSGVFHCSHLKVLTPK